jgi:hypothetical protein
MTIWSVYEIPEDYFYYFKIGSLSIWLKRSQKEWIIATENDFSKDKASQINIGRKTPDYGKNVKLISPSRLKADTSLFKKSFQFIKDLTGF